MAEIHDLILLAPESTRLFYHGGILRLTLPDRSYVSARVYRAFPVSDPDHYSGLTDGAGKEIGIIADPSRLDETSRTAAETELDKRYFVPVVTRVVDIRDDFGATIFEVETNRGQHRYVVRGIRDNIVELSHRRLLVTDVDGNRFEIADLNALDPRSQNVLLRSM
jgi:hypothetical protein